MSLAQNKKANLEYEFLERFEAGLVLTGQEIKAIRGGRANLNGTFCRVMNGEIFVLNMHISNTDEPERSRKLLMKKGEILALQTKTTQHKLVIVPLSLYLKKGKAKLEIALGRGKKLYDHRDDLKKKDLSRQADRELKE